MHFRFYRGTGADFLNLSRVDIWARQVFLGEGTCTLQGVSQRPRPLSTGCSSHLSLSRDNQKCAQTLLERYPLGNQFLVEKHWAGVNAGFPLSSGREILLTGLEWWRWTWDEQMGLQRPGDELSSTWGDRPITMIQFSILSLLLSFSIPPALKKESGLVLGILIVGWQKVSMWNVNFSFTLL